MSATSALRVFVRRLKSVDLPTLGRPTRARVGSTESQDLGFRIWDRGGGGVLRGPEGSMHLIAIASHCRWQIVLSLDPRSGILDPLIAPPPNTPSPSPTATRSRRRAVRAGSLRGCRRSPGGPRTCRRCARG